MLTVTTLLLLAGCSGSPPEINDPTPGPEPAGPALPPLSCPAGSSVQSGVSSKGTEAWCDRGGIMHGPYVRLYPSGARAVKGAYDNNQPDGDWFWWHENSTEASKGKYVRGKQTGPWTWWHENGSRAEEGDFLQGRKAGQWVSWYESGVKKDDGMYHNGIKDGLWTYYEDNPDNPVARTELWEEGAVKEESILRKDGKAVGKSQRP